MAIHQGSLNHRYTNMSFLGGATMLTYNPTNNTASMYLGYINDIPTLRYGGTGTGSASGFQILGAGDNWKFKFTEAGTMSILNSIEIGQQDGSAHTPYIDFHSGTAVIDYDARIIASGGTGINGKGTLNVQASQLQVNSNRVLTDTPTTYTAGYLNGWSTYNSSYGAAQAVLNDDGTVVLKGLAMGGTVSTTMASSAIMVLPSNMRPVTKHVFTVQTATGVGRVDVDNLGNVSAITGGNGWFALSGIVFTV